MVDATAGAGSCAEPDGAVRLQGNPGDLSASRPLIVGGLQGEELAEAKRGALERSHAAVFLRAQTGTRLGSPRARD